MQRSSSAAAGAAAGGAEDAEGFGDDDEIVSRILELEEIEERFNEMFITSEEELPDPAGAPPPPPALPLAPPPVVLPLAPPPVRRKRAWTVAQAKAEGIRVVCRMRSDDKREFPVRKTAAKNSDLTEEAKLGVVMDAKDMELETLKARAKMQGKRPYGKNRLRYKAAAIAVHYGISVRMVEKCISECNLGQLASKREGGKPQLTNAQVRET